MPVRQEESQLYVVLYQSCPHRDYIRHTALRALCLFFALFSLGVAIGYLASAHKDQFPYTVIFPLVVDSIAVALVCLSLAFRVHHEKCRVRDDVLRAGAGGDVRAQVARLESAHRGHDEQPVSTAEPSPPLLVFEYANRRYWCVQPRRPDGDGPSTDECFEASAREDARRTHDLKVGTYCFYATGASAIGNAIACSSSGMVNTTDMVDPVTFVTTLQIMFGICMGLMLVATALLIVPLFAGVPWRRTAPVPDGVIPVSFSAEGESYAASYPVPRYQEALPGPPLDELEAGVVVSTTNSTRVEWPHRLTESHAPDTDTDGERDAHGKTKRELWVWGGFARNRPQPTSSSSSPSDPPSADTPTKSPVLAVPTQWATAPPGEDSESNLFNASESDPSASTRLRGQL